MLRMVSKFVSKEQTRYYLGGVQFEPHPDGGIIMIATDGRRLAAMHDAKGFIKGAASAIIPVDGHLNIALGRPKAVEFHQRGHVSYVVQVGNIDDSIEEIGACHLYTAYNKPVDGTFPDWRRVVPKETTLGSIKSICFNQRYVQDFVKILGKGGCGVEAFFTDENSPTLFRCSKYPEFLGVLMPMSGNFKTAYPEWYK